MCFVSLTYLYLCWTEFFDNITFHTVRPSPREKLRGQLISGVTQLAGWPERLHVTGLGNQWQPRGSLGLGQLIWVPAENDGIEILGSAGGKGWLEKSVHARCSLPQKQTHGSHSVSTLLKLSGLSLRGKREHLPEEIWIYHLCLTWKLGCLETLVSHSYSPPTRYRVAKGDCCYVLWQKWSRVSQPS